MLTQDMKRQLGAMGYSAGDIAHLTPQQAHEILAGLSPVERLKAAVRRVDDRDDPDAWQFNKEGAGGCEPVSSPPYEVLGSAPAGERCDLCGKGGARIKYRGEVCIMHLACADRHVAAMADPPIKLPPDDDGLGPM